jgi:hypothetical protein
MICLFPQIVNVDEYTVFQSVIIDVISSKLGYKYAFLFGETSLTRPPNFAFNLTRNLLRGKEWSKKQRLVAESFL